MKDIKHDLILERKRDNNYKGSDYIIDNLSFVKDAYLCGGFVEHYLKSLPEYLTVELHDHEVDDTIKVWLDIDDYGTASWHTNELTSANIGESCEGFFGKFKYDLYKILELEYSTTDLILPFWIKMEAK